MTQPGAGEQQRTAARRAGAAAAVAGGAVVATGLAGSLGAAAYVARSPREEQLVTVIADAAAPLRTAAASLLELQGRPAVSPKAALREAATAVTGPEVETTLARVSEARERRTLAPGVAGATLLELVALARALRARLHELR